MGLEKLQSVFNNISENEADLNDELPVPRIKTHISGEKYSGPITSDTFTTLNHVLQPDGTYLPLGKIPINASVEESPMANRLEKSNQTPSATGYYSGYENQEGKTLDGKFYEGLNRPEDITNENIRFFYVDGENIGSDNLLGLGDKKLENIFDPTHGSAFKERPAGVGDTSNLNIKAHGTIGRTGILPRLFGSGQEPYIVHNIPDSKAGIVAQGLGYNRDGFPLRAAADDISRILAYSTSTDGILARLAENVTNFAIGDNEFTNPLAATMFPPLPVPMTGFLNSYHASAQGFGGGLGNPRKPFKVEYSSPLKLFPYVNQGDRPIGLEEFQNITIPPGKNRVTRKIAAGLEKLRDKLGIVLEGALQIPVIETTPFIKPNKGGLFGKSIISDDRVAKSGVISSTLEEVDDVVDGDFYVRFKDLRDEKYIYFRGFVTAIAENVSPVYNPTQYIGRSEDVYIYQKAERDLSFNLKVYPNTKIEFEQIYSKINRLTSLAYPQYMDDDFGTAKNALGNFNRMKAPFTELYLGHIGSRTQGQFGFIKSLTYTVPDGGDWDAYSALPRMFEIAITYQILSKRPPRLGDEFYRNTVEAKKAPIKKAAPPQGNFRFRSDVVRTKAPNIANPDGLTAKAKQYANQAAAVRRGAI